MDASKTPVYGDFQKNFVQVVRATGFLLGVSASGLGAALMLLRCFRTVDESIFNGEVRSVLKDRSLSNSESEWALKTQFEPTDELMRQWADAQKLVYSKGAGGWIAPIIRIRQYWNFKVEKSPLVGDLLRGWYYLEGFERGYFTKDPSQYHDPNVCAPYI
ncbi:hypothetical protein C8R47DRAFT_1076255 [Mycena vitilis]|nr:hypothetical protein C8R47DRAFT_1076255 [Mycena vitilis]